MADAADSKSAGRKVVWVRLPPPAVLKSSVFSTFRPSAASKRDRDLYHNRIYLDQEPGECATGGAAHLFLM